MRFNAKYGIRDKQHDFTQCEEAGNWNLLFIQLKFIFNSTLCIGVPNFAYTNVSVSDVSGTTLTLPSNKKKIEAFFKRQL